MAYDVRESSLGSLIEFYIGSLTTSSFLLEIFLVPISLVVSPPSLGYARTILTLTL